MTIPNLITILRVVLAPIFIIYIINDRILGSLIIFLIASISDALDGFIARIFHQKSDFGAYLDPMADKILLVSAYITLAVLKMIPPWLAILIISRDVIILLGVLILYMNRHPLKVHPSLLSKSTTCLQIGTILMILSSGYLTIESIKIYAFWVTAGLTIGSGLQYIRTGLIILTKDEKTNFA